MRVVVVVIVLFFPKSVGKVMNRMHKCRAEVILKLEKQPLSNLMVVTVQEFCNKRNTSSVAVEIVQFLCTTMARL